MYIAISLRQALSTVHFSLSFAEVQQYI